MKVLMLDAPESILEERHRLGLDVQDEMWSRLPVDRASESARG